MPTNRKLGHSELADAIPHIVWKHDMAGRPTYFNRAWSQYTGLELEKTLVVGAETFVHPDDVAEVTRLFTQSRVSGAPLKAVYRLRRAVDGVYRWHEATVVPLVEEGGHVQEFVGTAIDIDDARRSGAQQRFLADAGRVLGFSLEFEKTLRDVAGLVVPGLADWCAVDLLNDAGKFERLAVAHVDPAKVELAQEIWRRQPPREEDVGGLYELIRSRKPQLVENITDEMLDAAITDPELLALYRALGLRSSLSVALVARDRVLGAVTVVTAESNRRFTQADLTFAEDVAGRMAMAVDNARLFRSVQEARVAADALTTDVIAQSSAAASALISIRAERDAALEKLAQVKSGRQ